MTRKHSYRMGTAIGAAICLSELAQGQTASVAAMAPGSTGELEEVVVTANRRAENLQDIPIAVTALSGASLLNSGVNDLTELGAVVAGLSVQQNAGFVTTHLRGVGSSILGPGLENPIALYVDGVYYASTSSSLLNFVNVADVQVLKGPQGTLFGRNSTGGLIQVTTRTPTQELHLDTDVSYGNYNTSKADLYVTGGIAENLAADFAAEVKHQGEGYGKNFSNGQDIYQDDFDGTVRSKWLYSPTSSTSLTAIFDFAHTRNSDNPLTLNPGTFASTPDRTYRFSNPWDTDSYIQPKIDNTSGGASLRLDQDVGFARIMDIAAYRRSATQLDINLDSGPLPQQGGLLYLNERQFSEELQLQSATDSRIKWAAGIYFFDGDGAYVPPSTVLLGTTPAGALGIGLRGEETTRSVAGYAQATREILPKTNLTLGLRYTHEDRGLIASQNLLTDAVVVAPIATADTSRSYARPTYRIALDHRFTDQTLGYASFNTGFKSGGYNTEEPTDPPFNPETLKAYEVGLKNDLLDRRLRLNIAAFYNSYLNVQEQRVELASSGVINGPPAKIYGLDLDLQAQVTHALRLSSGFEYLHARFVGSDPPLPIGTPCGCVPEVSGSVEGNRLPDSPDAVVTVSADYSFTVLGGETGANATFEHNTGWYSEPDNVIHQPAYSKLNLSVRWTSPDTRYTMALWCNNVTNVAVLGSGATGVDGVQFVQYEAPRTFWITVGYHL
jgi:iron complex outermembrane recepter protein